MQRQRQRQRQEVGGQHCCCLWWWIWDKHPIFSPVDSALLNSKFKPCPSFPRVIFQPFASVEWGADGAVPSLANKLENLPKFALDSRKSWWSRPGPPRLDHCSDRWALVEWMGRKEEGQSYCTLQESKMSQVGVVWSRGESFWVAENSSASWWGKQSSHLSSIEKAALRPLYQLRNVNAWRWASAAKVTVKIRQVDQGKEFWNNEKRQKKN